MGTHLDFSSALSAFPRLQRFFSFSLLCVLCGYAEAVLKFAKLNTTAQQRGAVVQGRSLLPYRLRYKMNY
ncbi:MAG: hypothetical protein LBK06_10495 [Planctomycetaceae bacterium]|nr:hypothetical protein [Planctomycetaceae bacterium]